MKSFSSLLLRRHLCIASNPAVDNEGEVVSCRNVVQSEKKGGKKREIYFGLVRAKTTESELMGWSNAL